MTAKPFQSHQPIILKKTVNNPCQPRRGVIRETPGEAWGTGPPLAGSLEEAEWEQDAHAVIHIRPLRGRMPAPHHPQASPGVFHILPLRGRLTPVPDMIAGQDAFTRRVI